MAKAAKAFVFSSLFVLLSVVLISSSQAFKFMKSAPVVSGTVALGQTLKVSNGTWNASKPKFAYQWYRCTSPILNAQIGVASSCQLIRGATKSTYKVVSADSNLNLTATVKMTAGKSTETVMAASLLFSTSSPPSVTRNPSLSISLSQPSSGVSSLVDMQPINPLVITDQTPVVGRFVLLDYGTWVGTPAPTVSSYAWFRCTSLITTTSASQPSNCTAIPEAQNALYYVLRNEDIGKYVSAAVIASNPSGTSIIWTPTTSQIFGAPVNLSMPTLDSDGLVGGDLTFSTGTWAATPNATLSTNIVSCTSPQSLGTILPSGCSVVRESVNSPYTVESDFDGNYLMVMVTANNEVGSTTVYSQTTPKISLIYSAPRMLTPPLLSGLSKVGSSLTTTDGTWSGYPVPDFTYSWYACQNRYSGGLNFVIPNDCQSLDLFESPITLPSEAHGKYVFAVVSASNYSGTISAATGSSDQVTMVPVNSVVPSVSGVRTVGSTLTASAGSWVGFPVPSFTYQWYRCDGQVSAAASVAVGCSVIDGATSSSYVVVDADAQRFVAVQVSASNSVGVVSHVSASTLEVGRVVSLVADPVVSGVARVGSSVSVSAGEWNGYPAPSLSYQWFSCSSSQVASSTLPSGCSSISGATSSTFTPTSTQRGTYVLARVTASNIFGSVVRFSGSSDQVTMVPVNSVVPSVSGVRTVGSTLTASAGSWVGFPVPSFTYQWYRCDGQVSAAASVAVGCSVIDGATSSSYVVVDADAQRFVAVQVSASNSVGVVSHVSASTQQILQAVSLVADPVVSGVARVGSSVSVSAGEWNGYPAPSLSYQWFSCSSSQVASSTLPSGCSSISGATSSTFTPTSTQRGTYVLARVIASNTTTSTNQVTRFSGSSDQVTMVPVNSVVPSVSGVRTVGSTLTASAGSWVGFPVPSFTYQWYRCDGQVSAAASVAVGCSVIDGATSSSYVVVDADAQRFVAVQVSASNSVGVVSHVSASTLEVGRVVSLVADPVVSGVARVGSSVSVSAGEWNGYPAPSLSYQWFSCSSSQVASSTLPSGCSSISGATSSTFTPTSTQRGTYVLARVTASNIFGSVVRFSGSSDQVTMVPVNSVVPSVSGVRTVGSTLTASAGSWVGFPVPSFTYQWYRCDGQVSAAASVAVGCSVIDGATSSSYVVVDADAQRFVAVQVSASNSVGVVSHVSASTQQILQAVSLVADPVVSGVARVGSSVSVSAGEWNGYPAPSLSYQWFSCSSSQVASSTLPSGCSSISGATSSTFTPTSTQRGTYVLARVIASNTTTSTNQVTRFSGSSDQVTMVPVNSVVPSVSGVRTVGSTLTASAGSWVGFPVPSFTYQWYRCDGQVSAAASVAVGCSVIDGATSSSYVVVDADAQRFVAVQVSASNSVGVVSHVSASTLEVGRVVSLVADPVVSGVARVGSSVSVSAGEWNGYPAPSLSYQWFSCSSSQVASSTLPSGCDIIVGAVDSGYVPTASEAGKYVLARVTASNIFGSVVRFSGSSDQVTMVPVNSVVPSVSGVRTVGSTLTASAGSWVGFPVPSFTYQWYRCDGQVSAAASVAVGCSVIDGATSSSYVVVDADAQRFVAVQVSASNSVGVVSHVSASTLEVGRVVSLVADPVVSGVARVGSSVSVSAGEWNGYPAPSLSYQWFSCSSSQVASSTLPSGCDIIVGAVDSGYVPTASEAGKYVLARVTASNIFGSVVRFSGSSDQVTMVPVNSVVPSVSGVRTVGSTLTASAGSWVGFPVPSFTYQWYRCFSAIDSTLVETAGCLEVSNDITSNVDYVIKSGDVGAFIVVKVFAQNEYGTNYQYSSTYMVPNSAYPINLTPPRMTAGEIRYIGQIQTGFSTGTWTYPNSSQFSKNRYYCNKPVDGYLTADSPYSSEQGAKTGLSCSRSGGRDYAPWWTITWYSDRFPEWNELWAVSVIRVDKSAGVDPENNSTYYAVTLPLRPR